MSWSVNAVGTPDKVVEQLEKYMADSSPSQSKAEYDAAKPHLVGLVKQNFVDLKKATWARGQLTIVLSANGSGSSQNGEIVQQSCACKIEVHSPTN